MATPKATGFDPDKLCALDKFIGQLPGARIHGVVVVRHGKLVMEHYYKGYLPPGSGNTEQISFGPTVKHAIMSISKSVISLLVGIAQGEGKFPDLSAPVFDHLPLEYATLRTPENARITIRDLLTMSSGLEWNELRPPYTDPKNIAVRMLTAPDPYRIVLQRPATLKPGEIFNYSSGDTELLGLLLARSVGRSVDAYAVDKLFSPLGITDVDWWRMRSGPPFAAGGLRLRPRDLAKLGQLLLTDGQWNGQQIIPKGWVAESTKPRLKAYQLRYGYQWWLGQTSLKDRDLPWIVGMGYGDQRLFVQPDLDLVVAATGGAYDDPQQRGAFPYAIFAQHVLPAIAGK